MGTMINRRRVCGKNAINEKSYIQDGLVFQLDGINKGNNPLAWTDLVGGHVFALTKECVSNDNNIEISSSTTLESQSNNSWTSLNSTIEVVFNTNNTSTFILVSNRSIEKGIGFGRYSNKIVLNTATSAPGSAYTANINSNENYTASGNAQLGCLNGQSLTRAYEAFSGSVDGNIYIGQRGRNNNGSPYPFIGKIYSIRIYNRLLTSDEMLHNQQIDNIRFNLGLNIIV